MGRRSQPHEDLALALPGARTLSARTSLLKASSTCSLVAPAFRLPTRERSVAPWSPLAIRSSSALVLGTGRVSSRCGHRLSRGRIRLGAIVRCLSLAGHRSGRLPGAPTTAGLASSAAGALSPLALTIEPALLLIPAARMSCLLVIAVGGTRLSRTSVGHRT